MDFLSVQRGTKKEHFKSKSESHVKAKRKTFGLACVHKNTEMEEMTTKQMEFTTHPITLASYIFSPHESILYWWYFTLCPVIHIFFLYLRLVPHISHALKYGYLAMRSGKIARPSEREKERVRKRRDMR